MPRRRSRVSPARACALAVLQRTEEQGAYADQALQAEARRAGLDGRDLGLATQLAFGTIQRKGTLDHLLGVLAGRPAAALDPLTRDALRLGLFQLTFLDAIPDHAAVDESVELAKAGRGHRLVNAVLRRAGREARPLVEALPEGTAEEAAVKHSHPVWLARMWWETLGPVQARALMAADNQPAEAAVRANTLVAAREEVLEELAGEGVSARPAPDLPEGLVVGSPWDIRRSSLWRRGAVMAQSRASMLVSRVLAPRSRERVLDLCAAPGAKSTHVAALMEDRGRVVAVERRPARARALQENCRRLRAGSVEVRVADARADHGRGFDRVLVDPPCSGLGTLRGRPDLRWRASPAAVARLARLQAQVLAAAAEALRPGGVLVYSACTISPPENELQVERLLRARPDMEVEDLRSDPRLWEHPTVAEHLLALPHRDGTDGFFIARLRRRAAAG